MTDGINIGILVRKFSNEDDAAKYPEVLAAQSRNVLEAAALDDNPNVLSEDEALELDSRLGVLYADFGSSYSFAERITEAKFENRISLSQLYLGFSRTAVSEPPFLVGNVWIDKVERKATTAGDELLINDSVSLSISVDTVILAGVTYLYFPIEEVVADLRVQGSDVDVNDFLKLDTLPWMPRYDAPGHQGWDVDIDVKSDDKVYVGTSRTGPYNNREANVYLTSDDKFATGDFPWGRDALALVDTPKDGASFNTAVHILPERVREEVYTRSYGCFTGGTMVTRQGGELGMATLAATASAWRTTPQVQAWNPNTNQLTYQMPNKVSEHGQRTDNGINLITYYDSNGQVAERPLQVTANHFLWIKRDGREFWVPVGEITEKDQLLYVGDGTKRWLNILGNVYVKSDQDMFQAVKGGKLKEPPFYFDQFRDRQLNVYNISFGGEGFSNYIVEGGIVAHNKLF